MKKMKKVLALVLCAMLLVVGSVMGTLAYLKDDAAVSNTFTVGNVEITMDEAKVDLYGVVDTTANRQTKNEYKLIPGHEYSKDPTIWVTAGSEDCWLFVEITNGIKNIVVDGTDSIENQMISKGWTLLSGKTNVYYKNHVKATATAETEGDNAGSYKYVIFDKFILKEDADVSGYATAANTTAKIDIKAYAVQADGLSDVTKAWEAASATE